MNTECLSGRLLGPNVHCACKIKLMDVTKQQKIAIGSSAVLAILTLSVFMTALNQGPVSAVMRFNDALVSDKPAVLRAVTSGDMDSRSLEALRRVIKNLNRMGSTFQITRTQQVRNEAVVIGVYSVPSKSVHSIVFSLHRYNRTWLVSPEMTVEMTSRQAGS